MILQSFIITCLEDESSDKYEPDDFFPKALGDLSCWTAEKETRISVEIFG
jgi:hypothetical protein